MLAEKQEGRSRHLLRQERAPQLLSELHTLLLTIKASGAHLTKSVDGKLAALTPTTYAANLESKLPRLPLLVNRGIARMRTKYPRSILDWLPFTPPLTRGNSEACSRFNSSRLFMPDPVPSGDARLIIFA